MADYLAENNYLFQRSFSSSYLYSPNFANKDTKFENALKTSDEQLNTKELTSNAENKRNIYTRIVSATVMNCELRASAGTNGITAAFSSKMREYEASEMEKHGEDKPIEESERSEKIIDTQEELKKLIEAYMKKDSNKEEVDWRNMTAEEWERLLARIDADIEDMIESVKEDSEDSISKDRKVIGLTTFPVSENESHMVIAYESPESTMDDPIVQLTMNDQNGETQTYNIHINDVNPNNATEMEIFAYLTYQGHIGNKIPGAINNYAAYKALKYQDDLHENNNVAEYGNRLFSSARMDAEAIIKHVFSWMKTINHPDAQKQAGWCEDLLEMLNPVNDKLDNYF